MTDKLSLRPPHRLRHYSTLRNNVLESNSEQVPWGKVEKNFEERVQQYVKPFTGKRRRPQSPVRFSSPASRRARRRHLQGVRRVRGAGRRVHFWRTERHDWFVGGQKPLEKLTDSSRVGVTAPDGIDPSADRGRPQNFMRPDSLLRPLHYKNHLLTYLLTNYQVMTESMWWSSAQSVRRIIG